MSRLIKKRTYPEHEKEYIAELRCDICGRKSSRPENRYPWMKGDVMVRLNETEHCPGGADIFFDICPDCFKGKLLPALFALGAQPRVKN